MQQFLLVRLPAYIEGECLMARTIKTGEAFEPWGLLSQVALFFTTMATITHSTKVVAGSIFAFTGA
jgi:hypothetical protein